MCGRCRIDELLDDKAILNGSSHRVVQYRIETVLAKQGVNRSAVAHKHFGRADQALSHVADPGW